MKKSNTTKEDVSNAKTSTEAESSSTDDKKNKVTQPPLQVAARRLDRLLSRTTTTSQNNSNDKNNSLIHEIVNIAPHANPCKIVKRWLGTSSAIASKATSTDIFNAANVLIDPNGKSATGRDLLLQIVTLAPPPPKEDNMEIDTMEEEAEDSGAPIQYLQSSSREVESWLLSLAIRLLWASNKNDDALVLSMKGIAILTTHLEEDESDSAAKLITSSSSLYPLLARLYRYQSLSAEKSKISNDSMQQMRLEMAYAHRMAVLKRDVDTQSTLLNSMLRDLLNASQVEQAQKLLANSSFPDSASNNQLCRYLYYSGRIQALRLEYTAAFTNLSQCLRKAPTNTGLGFRIAAQRLLVVVQLLMGEVPDRNVFFGKGMKGELEPYLKITQAVRRGDLAVFRDTTTLFQERLVEDGMFTLISRLAHSVVKAGLRRLSTSYSCITLTDIASRLGLASAESAEFVVAKAVRDGVIDATINREEGYVQSNDLVDVYATTEPTDAFHRRIAYCLTTHNDAVRSMRYPPDAYKKELEASRGLRGKKDEDKTDEEKAQELEDELDGDY